MEFLSNKFLLQRIQFTAKNQVLPIGDVDRLTACRNSFVPVAIHAVAERRCHRRQITSQPEFEIVSAKSVYVNGTEGNRSN